MVRKCCKIFLIGIVVLAGLVFMAKALTGQDVFYENRTASAPRGIYMRCLGGSPGYGDYVIVALDRDMGVLRRGHLMLKQVKGFPGEWYNVTDKGMEVRGKLYAFRDIPGLPKPGKGMYIVPHGQYLLLNDSPDSFDSRYLGPSGENGIRCRVKMVFSYEPLARLFAI